MLVEGGEGVPSWKGTECVLGVGGGRSPVPPGMAPSAATHLAQIFFLLVKEGGGGWGGGVKGGVGGGGGLEGG